MPRIGYTWDQEYRQRYYSSERVQVHLQQFVEQASQPKTAEQRAKMSQSKLGRTYDPQHRARMSETQRHRYQIKKQLLATNPDLPMDQVWRMVKLQMEQST